MKTSQSLLTETEIDTAYELVSEILGSMRADHVYSEIHPTY